MSTTESALEAIREGDATRLRTVLAGDANSARERDPSGVSLLMWACYFRQRDCVGVLRELVDTLDVFEAAALGDIAQLSAQYRADQAQAAAWSADGFQPIHLASFFAQLDAMRLLVDLHVDVNTVARNPSGVRPLHSAAASRSAEAVRVLLEAGADPNVRQQGGWTPLHSAALHNDTAMVRWLLDHGADKSLKSDDGKTAGDLAGEKNHAAVVEMLG
jgi:uncharacterized protein